MLQSFNLKSKINKTLRISKDISLFSHQAFWKPFQASALIFKYQFSASYCHQINYEFFLPITNILLSTSNYSFVSKL